MTMLPFYRGFFSMLPGVTDSRGSARLRWLRPTLDVVGIWGGFTGRGIKTIVPSKATAKISCRLVPDQDPEHVLTVLERHVAANPPPQTRLSFQQLTFKATPYIMPRDTLANRAASKVISNSHTA